MFGMPYAFFDEQM